MLQTAAQKPVQPQASAEKYILGKGSRIGMLGREALQHPWATPLRSVQDAGRKPSHPSVLARSGSVQQLRRREAFGAIPVDVADAGPVPCLARLPVAALVAPGLIPAAAFRHLDTTAPTQQQRQDTLAVQSPETAGTDCKARKAATSCPRLP